MSLLSSEPSPGSLPSQRKSQSVYEDRASAAQPATPASSPTSCQVPSRYLCSSRETLLFLLQFRNPFSSPICQLSSPRWLPSPLPPLPSCQSLSCTKFVKFSHSPAFLHPCFPFIHHIYSYMSSIYSLVYIIVHHTLVCLQLYYIFKFFILFIVTLSHRDVNSTRAVLPWSPSFAAVSSSLTTMPGL